MIFDGTGTLVMIIKDRMVVFQVPRTSDALCHYACCNLPLLDSQRTEVLKLHGYHQRLYYLLSLIEKVGLKISKKMVHGAEFIIIINLLSLIEKVGLKISKKMFLHGAEFII